jgi:hypothetical protein
VNGPPAFVFFPASNDAAKGNLLPALAALLRRLAATVNDVSLTKCPTPPAVPAVRDGD